jgi:hypothetical protein
MFKSCEQHAQQSSNMKMGNKFLEQFKYLGTAQTNQNALMEEITEGLRKRVLVIV